MPRTSSSLAALLMLTTVVTLSAVAVAVGAATGQPINPMDPATYGDMKEGVMQLDAKGVMRPTGQTAEELAAKGEAPRKVFVPAFDEEESSTYNSNIAERYQCDACTGIAFTMTNAFVVAEKLTGGTKGPTALPESEFFDIVEKACAKDLTGKYGIKSRHGNAWDKVFSGPGLHEAMELPDGQFGGSHWDRRMIKMCEEMVDEFTEEGMYAMHRSSTTNLKKGMCKKKCAVKHPPPAMPQQPKAPAAATPPPSEKGGKGAAGDSAEIAALRAENAKVKAQLAACAAELEKAQKSLEEMIEVMDK